MELVGLFGDRLGREGVGELGGLRRASLASAVTATMLLEATGSAVTFPSSFWGLSGESSVCLTRSATSMFVTRREAVSTSRVGSEDSGINPGRPIGNASVLDTGVISRSASASYTLSAVTT